MKGDRKKRHEASDDDVTSNKSEATLPVTSEPVVAWRDKPLAARIGIVVLLWFAYSVVVITDAVYANSWDFFTNVSSKSLLHDVVPAQYVLILQTMVGVWQLFFLVYNSLATLTNLNMTEMPLPVIPLYISALVINLFVTLAMYLESDVAVILISSFIPAVLIVGAFLSITSTYTSPIPILPLCCYNPQVLYATFMIYTILYHICRHATSFGTDHHIVGLVLASIVLAVILLCMIIDIIPLDKYMQRVWSPYISTIISTVYLTVHNWEKPDQTKYVYMVSAIVLSVGWLIKLVRSAQLTFRKPYLILRKRWREKQARKVAAISTVV